MWAKILEYAQTLIFLQRETQQNKSDIKECEQEIKENKRDIERLRADFNNLVLLVQKLSFDIEQVSNRETTEREKMALQLENEMLKFERRLPQGKDIEK